MSLDILSLGHALTGTENENRYAETLAPYAVKKGIRKKSEDDRGNRTEFQRDRDRIIHSEAFRRLLYKTQVFVNHEGDHFRTRLTHTLEVSQFARGICKSLALNEELAEAIALGHDLGHTPFGHRVERYFDNILKTREMGRFFHNEQSVRVVDFLESRKLDIPGLNLTNDVREGILKHNSSKNRSGGKVFVDLLPSQICSHLEGQVVAIADTMAYVCHDLEDSIKAGIVYRNTKKNKDFESKFIKIKAKTEEVFGITMKYDPYEDTFFIRDLIHFLITDLTESTYLNLKEKNINSSEDVSDFAKNGVTLVQFSKDVDRFFEELKTFAYSSIYESETISLMDDKAEALVKDLFDKLEYNPILLPPNWLYKYHHIRETSDPTGMEFNEVRLIIDYISSMTDRYALEQHERLFNARVRL